MPGQVVAVASGKGGVGKTTTVTNLGVVLRRSNHSVALVDADLGMANLAPMLGISGDQTLHDVLAGRADLDEALVTETSGFAVLPGSETLTNFSAADPSGLGAVLDSLAEDYDFVLVDTGAGMTHEGVLPLSLADQVLLVTSPDPAAVENTKKTAKLTELADGVIAGVVVTKADETIDADEVAARIGVELLGIVPFDPTVRRSTAAGKPLEAVDPDSPAAAAYREFATVLTPTPAEPSQPAGDSMALTSSRDGQAAEGGEGKRTVDSEPSEASGSAMEPPDVSSETPGTKPPDSEAPSSEDGADQRPAVNGDSSGPDPEPTTVEDSPSGASNSRTAPAAESEAEPDEATGDGSDGIGDDGTVSSDPDPASEPPDRESSSQRSGFLGWLGRLFR